MHIQTRNVNTAFHTLVAMFATREYQGEDGAWGRLAGAKAPIVERPSRNGKVLMVDEPVTITYSHPRERVLFNSARDANPFFHMFEALHFLAGRNDVGSLAYYASKMRDFSDDGKTLNGAYGYRWRKAKVRGAPELPDDQWPMKVDQLDLLVAHLKADPNSRRAVLQMWNVEDDLLKIGRGKPAFCDACGYARKTTLHDLGSGTYKCDGCGTIITTEPASKDVCCNLSVMFSLREPPESLFEEHEKSQPELKPYRNKNYRYLDMTVISRSEDLIWGLLGADYVDFTVLQEYMAKRLQAEVGRYHHVANNLHAYDWNWEPKKWLDWREEYGDGEYTNSLPHVFNPFPLVKDPAAFDQEVKHLVETFAGNSDKALRFEEPFLENVAKPALTAFRYHKRGQTSDVALGFAANIAADDWRMVCTEWLERRKKS